METYEEIKKILYSLYFETDLNALDDPEEIKRHELLNLNHNRLRIGILCDILNEEINKLKDLTK